MFKQLTALASVLMAGVIAQDDVADNSTNSTNTTDTTAGAVVDPSLLATAVYIEYDWTFNDNDSDEIGQLMQDWHDWMEFNTDVYEMGTLLNTVGWRDRDEELHQAYLFIDHEALQYFVDNVVAATELRQRTGELKPNMQWAGEIWGAVRPEITDIETVFPNCLFNEKDVDIFGYGPYVNGVLQYRADRDTEEGPMVINVAMKSNGTENHERGVEWFRGFAGTMEGMGMFGLELLNFRVEENEEGFTGTVALLNGQAYEKYNQAIEQWEEVAKQNATIGSFGEHTEIVWIQYVALEDTLRDYDLDREDEVYFGLANLAIYGEAYFGLVELEETSVSFTELAALAFVLDIGAGGWNLNTWESTNDKWRNAYIAQFATGTLGLVSLAAGLLVDMNILLQASLLYIVMQFATLALVTMAHSDTPNDENDATILSFVASGFGIAVAAAANFWYRVAA